MMSGNYITVDGINDTETAHCKRYGLNARTFRNRLRIGWSVEDALKTQSQKRKHDVIDRETCNKCGGQIQAVKERLQRGYLEFKGRCVNGHTTYIGSRPMTQDERNADHHTFRAPLPHLDDTSAPPISVETMRTWFRWQSVRMSA